MAAVTIFFASREVNTAITRWKARRDEDRVVRRRHTEALDNLSVLTEKFTAAFDGTVRACEAIAVATDKHREAVAAFGVMIHAPKAPYPEDAMINSTDDDARRSGETFMHILRGLSPEEAAARADADDQKKTALSAISLGPEE